VRALLAHVRLGSTGKPRLFEHAVFGGLGDGHHPGTGACGALLRLARTIRQRHLSPAEKDGSVQLSSGICNTLPLSDLGPMCKLYS